MQVWRDKELFLLCINIVKNGCCKRQTDGWLLQTSPVGIIYAKMWVEGRPIDQLEYKSTGSKKTLNEIRAKYGSEKVYSTRHNKNKVIE